MFRKLCFILLLLISGCTEPVDFEKWEEVNVDATYISTLIFLDLNVSSFLNESNDEITFLSDLVEIPISEDIISYIEKIEFTIIVSNSFNRSFDLDFELYDENNNPIYTIQPGIHSEANTFDQSFVLVIPNEDIDVISNMNYIGAEIFLNLAKDGGFLNGTENFDFKLKSAMKIFVNY